jgi:hypothetical protein
MPAAVRSGESFGRRISSSNETRPLNPGPSRELRERRRKVLIAIGGAIAGTLLLGAIPVFRMLWDLTIVCTVLGCCYLGMLVYVTKIEAETAERERKVVPFMRARSLAFQAQSGRVAMGGGGHFETGGALASAPLPSRPAFVVVEAPS